MFKQNIVSDKTDKASKLWCIYVYIYFYLTNLNNAGTPSHAHSYHMQIENQNKYSTDRSTEGETLYLSKPDYCAVPLLYYM